MADWISNPDAARLARVGESTIRRRVRAGQLPAHTGDGGATLVDAQAAKALVHLPRAAATTSAKPASSSTASGGGGSSSSGTAPQIQDGQLAARVFQALEAGSRPVDLVTQLQAAPVDIASLVQAWRGLRASDGAATLADRVGALEAQVVALQAELAAVRGLLPPEDGRCPGCGRAHTLALALHCLACGAPAVATPPAPAPAAA